MRYFNGGVLCASFALLGCAHQQRVDTPVTAAAVESYRSVRAGAQATSVADSVKFCAGDGDVEVMSTRARGTDDWADKFRDRDVQEDVRGVIGRDPTLARQPLSVNVHEGAAIIGGIVERDADAVAAARQALAVPGVVAVELQTDSRETPTKPLLVASLCE